MATIGDWLEGARIRTLPAAVAPVLIGAGIAIDEGKFSLTRTLLAAGVALAFQIGSNFSNDYSDGVRGTDDVRTGPPRLTGGGKVKPKTVKMAAFASFGVGALLGLALVAVSGLWWLLAFGAACILAAWFYTGGDHPYGYMGLGEIFVLAFFGYGAVMGTVYTQTENAPWTAWVAATGVGLIACALLMVNNIRDIPTDSQVGKVTLAVRLGDRRARIAYVALLVVPMLLAFGIALAGHPWVWLSALLLGPVALQSRTVLGGAKGRDLIKVLRNTGLIELGYGILLLVGFAL